MRSFIIASVVTSIASTAIAQTAKYTGNGNPNNQWHVGANWEDGSVPNSPGINVEIGVLGSFNVNAGPPLIANDTEINNLTIGSSSSLNLGNGANSSFINYGLTANNNGAITLPNGGDLLIDSQTIFGGTGSITLSVGGLISSNVPATTIARFHNDSNTVLGAGNIGSNADIRLTNGVNGIIRANDPTGTMTIAPYGGVDAIVNQGLMESSGGTLSINNGIGNPGGVVRINNVNGTIGARFSGNTYLNGQIMNGGAYSSTDGGVLRLNNCTVTNAGYSIDETSRLLWTGGTHTNVGVSNLGIIETFSNISISPSAAISNTGQIQMNSGSGTNFTFLTDTSFAGGGSLNLNGAASLDGAFDAELETLGNGFGHLMRGRGSIGLGESAGSLKIINEGTIASDISGSMLQVRFAGRNAQTIENVNAGLIEVKNGATLQLSGAGAIVSVLKNFSNLGPGQIVSRAGSTLQLGTINFTLDGGTVLGDGGTIELGTLTRTGGTIELNATSLLRTTGAATVGGTTTVHPGATFRVQSSTLTLSSDAVVNNSGTFEITGGTLNNNGRIYSSIVTNNGNFNQNTTQVGQLSQLVGTGTTNVNANSILTLDSIRQNVINIALTGELKLDATNPSDGVSSDVSRVNSALQISSSGPNGGRLDLGKDAFIYDYPGTSPLAIVRTWITAGYANGAWTGNFIRSSDAATDSSLGIGYAEAAAILSIPGPWLGDSITTPALLIRTTLKGDGDLDGDVDFNDLLRVAQSYGLTSTGEWWLGDFNYDRNVNFNDLLLVAQNYGTMLSDSDLVQSPMGSFESDWTFARSMVPEPMSLCPIILVAISLVRCRRHM